jgi:hypothetical protein
VVDGPAPSRFAGAIALPDFKERVKTLGMINDLEPGRPNHQESGPIGVGVVRPRASGRTVNARSRDDSPALTRQEI